VAADAKPNAGGHWRPLAATCGHSIGCKWLPLRRELNAGGHWRTLAATGGHWRPLDWLQVAASGCKWLQVAADEKKMLVATGGHSIGRKWVQVAADEKRI